MRPIVFFDLETTGTSVDTDRIVQIACIKVQPDGSEEEKVHLIHPERRIPKAATAIHGISDADVKDAPRFAQLAKSMAGWFSGCDLAGYNSDYFDVPMLAAEFARCGISFPEPGTHLVDVLRIERRVNSHTLAATYARYTGQDLTDAHDALADARATRVVFAQQLSRNPDLPQTAAELDPLLNPGRVDIAGKLSRVEGVICWAFGKHRGQPVKADRGYAEWALGADFSEETKAFIREALKE
ncbi:MAG: 3'-5' exonuclease [Bacteroidetes bacterium]|nr:MAG: 3'-5' exonuclease [Bacteroidota bacterium]